MRIGVDIDQVCYDWTGAWRYMMKAYRGVDMPPADEFWTEWKSQEGYGTPEDRQWMHTEGVKLGLYRFGHVIKGTWVGLTQLHEMGHELEAITHRPRNAVPDTLAWLSYLNFPWSGVHILTSGEPKTNVRVSAMIDDKPETVEAFANQGRTGILFDCSWNREYEPLHWQKIYRAQGWPEVVEIVRGL